MRGRKTVSCLFGMAGAASVLLFGTGPAWGAVTHPYTGHSFGPCGLTPSSCTASVTDTFSNPQSVAVDQSTGDVFVYDAGAGTVYKFNASGEPEAFSGLAGSNAITGVGGAGTAEQQIAVDSSSGPNAGDIYVAHGATVQLFSQAGTPLEELGEAAGHPWGESCGVTVGPAGNVYVGLYHGGGALSLVSEYTPASGKQLITGYQASMAGLFEVCNVAVDGEGDVYAATYNPGGVSRYDHSQFGVPAPTATGTLIDGSGQTLAVDPASGDVYIDESDQIVEYGASGGRLGVSGAGLLSGSYGVAVNHATGEVYAAVESGTAEILGPPVTVPDVTTGSASKMHKTRAAVSGLVNPDGVEGKATYYVQYGTSAAYGEQTAEAEAVEGSSNPQEVSVPLAGLEPERNYHYRLVAVNKNGVDPGEDRTFTTGGAVDVSVPCSASEVSATGATLNSITDSEDTPAVFYEFQYGLSPAYGLSVGLKEFPAVEAEEPFSAHIEGLTPNTLYHCRLVGRIDENGEGGSSEGADATFKTLTAVPAVNDRVPFVTGVAPHEATLHGTINPGNGITTYRFVYGTTPAYGSSTPEAFTQLNYEDEALEQLITGLQPGTVYHYALVAENESGTTTGLDQTFTTLSVPAVEPGLEQPSAIPETPAVLTLPGTPVLLSAVVFPKEESVQPPPSRKRPKKCGKKLPKKRGKRHSHRPCGKSNTSHKRGRKQ
jgi:hypothetical protein